MDSLIIIIALCVIIVYQGVLNKLDRMNAEKKERDLLNRIMATDYAQYVQSQQEYTLAKYQSTEEGYPIEEGVNVS